MNRIAIILAGGSGTRLWPLSTQKRPKPLLEVFNHKTMLENTIVRAKLFTDVVYVLTEADKETQIKKVIADLNLNSDVLIEPTSAGTEAAIAYSVARIKLVHGDNAAIAFLPVDHRIKNIGAFYRDANGAVDAAAHGGITLFGITPYFPATGYGYIHLGQRMKQESEPPRYNIKEFLEKPDEKTAKELIKNEEVVWNSGIYVGSIRAFEILFKLDGVLCEWYQKIAEGQDVAMPSSVAGQQFEQALVEHAADLHAVVATFDWSDIGTYDALHRAALQRDEHSNALEGNVIVDDCDDCLVLGRNKKIVVMGLNDVAVIDGPDGILVCKKSSYSQFVGKVATGKEQPGKYHG